MASTLKLPGDPAQLPGDPAQLNDWNSALQLNGLALWVDDVTAPPAANPPVSASVIIHEDTLVVARKAVTWTESEEQASVSAAMAHNARTDLSMTQASFAVSGTAITDNSSVHALRVDVAKATYTVPVTNHALDGTGLKIGILSDSFNLLGGESADQTNGDLGASITIMKEGSTGKDEGRAMAQLIHSIAPNAQIYFYTATSSESDFANGIKQLATNGCTVIVDDVIFLDEPFYQDTGVITKAVEQVIGQGVSYFTAAGNSGKNYYENSFTPLTVTLAGIGTVKAHDIGGGSPYEKVEFTANGSGNSTMEFTLEWTEAFPSVPTLRQYNIGVALFDLSGNFIKKWTLNSLFGNPVLQITDTLAISGEYRLVFYESSGSVTPGIFKIIMSQNSTGVIDGVGAGFGSGTSFGHQIVAGANAVAAVSYHNTPANGVATPVVESFSAQGGGLTYINSGGTTLGTPIAAGNPDFAATDGSPTSVFNPFNGTSAAAPNAAAVDLLVIQADIRLSNVQQTYVLVQSAVSTGDSKLGGAGLIQADVAVGLAVTAATTPIWQGASGVGTGTWSTANDWSNNATPASTDAVSIGNGIGALSGSYVVTFDPTSATIASLIVDGGVASIVPDLRISAMHSLSVSGSVTVGSGLIEVLGTMAVTGALFANARSGTGISLASGGVLSVGGADALGISFSGTGGSLFLSASDSTTLTTGLIGGISNFNAGDTLELSGLSYSAALGIAYSSLTASIYNGTVSNVVAQLALQGGFSGLALARDTTTGGTLIVACYVRGTRIDTPDGPRAVEELATGDRVSTVHGQARPIEWVGRRSYAGALLAGQATLMPIRIRAGALGHGVPVRDLLVSPQHAMFLDGALVPASELVNGVSIVVETNLDRVDYFHIELAEHDLIWAEGAASETFVDDGGRSIFDNAAAYWHQHPHHVRHAARYCAPRLQDGYALEALRQRLAQRAGLDVPVPQPAELHGWLEVANPGSRIAAGWAQDPDNPEAPVCLDIEIGGVLVTQTLANRHRPDFEAAGLDRIWCGFYAVLPESGAGEIRAFRSMDRKPLPFAHAAGPAATRAA